MSFRRRLLLACSGAVAVAVCLAAVLAYVVVRDTLMRQLDDSLRHGEVTLGPGEMSALAGPVVFRQLLTGQAAPEEPPAGAPDMLVASDEVQKVATGERDAFFTDSEALGQKQRVYVSRTPEGVLISARPLTEVDDTLSTLRLGLGAILIAGIAAALLLGRIATRAAVRPVVELTEAAEHVARTRDLSRRISREGDDELSRLASAFDTMLGELDASQRAQRRLVADASHELRTPLTSLRTNMEVLGREHGLAPPDRERLRSDVVHQLEELTLLVADLVELARDEAPAAERELVRLDELVEGAVERAARHAPAMRFDADLEPALVVGVPARIDRAIANLLDNAAKYSPPGSQVEVRVRDGVLTVRDHGPGIAPDDLPYVFDRFFRAPAARGRPGSGLGLAIVRQVADVHGGTVDAASAPGGGAVLRLALPSADS